MAAEEDHTESEQDALRSSAASVGRTFFRLDFGSGMFHSMVQLGNDPNSEPTGLVRRMEV